LYAFTIEKGWKKKSGESIEAGDQWWASSEYWGGLALACTGSDNTASDIF